MRQSFCAPKTNVYTDWEENNHILHQIILVIKTYEYLQYLNLFAWYSITIPIPITPLVS